MATNFSSQNGDQEFGLEFADKYSWWNISVQKGKVLINVVWVERHYGRADIWPLLDRHGICGQAVMDALGEGDAWTKKLRGKCMWHVGHRVRPVWLEIQCIQGSEAKVGGNGQDLEDLALESKEIAPEDFGLWEQHRTWRRTLTLCLMMGTGSGWGATHPLGSLVLRSPPHLQSDHDGVGKWICKPTGKVRQKDLQIDLMWGSGRGL